MRLAYSREDNEKFEAARPYVTFKLDTTTNEVSYEFKEGTPQKIIDDFYESLKAEPIF